ncbi:hypothetical protein M514_11000 [Trichuris suis]|uniref:NEDD8-activating enzyme E1 catalytic subunit n=1 Tax=Trichuris suis TaxID=68888 RepID=A0A085LT23_9BILA|nr:hypothetical protein M513_11000 [Trichuris suis]KFD61809.1 hypothetical protein M514_11000 [Trichuris suis]
MLRQWMGVRKLLEHASPLAHPEFVPSAENIELIHSCKVLVVGAGGLGCELLKDLALSGFQNIHVIDMDTIELSNLNRQFLFREKDVGSSKAVTAAEAIKARVPGCNVTAIEDKDSSFYQDFNVIVSGLDSVAARRWINNMLVRLLRYNEDGSLDPSSVIPLVDGGVEGFKGNVRVILPGISPCIECYIDLYPPPVTYPICTISNTPRSPEHCIEYARLVSWTTERPFEGKAIDGDNPAHINWIYEKALQRANSFGIAGVTYRLTQGVVKRIIPAVASTNAVVAATCALEVFKLASCCALPIKNYMSFQDAEGIYMKTLELERRDDCRICSQKDIIFETQENAHLDDIRLQLINDPVYHLKNPSFSILEPSPRILYFPPGMGVAEDSQCNLSKTLKGDPVIQCGVDYIALHFRTKEPFRGKVFVKGHFLSPECQVSWNDSNSRQPQSGGTIWVKHGRCGMHRLRMMNPHGVQFSNVIVVSFHPVFITRMDRAYHVKCDYMETRKSVAFNMDVSPLTVTQIAQSFPLPTCSYTIRKDELDGEILKYAKVGQQVVHRWECDTNAYGMLVHSCFVEDGQGKKVLVIDDNGCHTDRLLLGDPTYVEALNMAYRESNVFKFADRLAVRFLCQIRLCLKGNEGCNGITPPTCESLPLTSDDRSVVTTTPFRLKRHMRKTEEGDYLSGDLMSQLLYVLDDDTFDSENLPKNASRVSNEDLCLSPLAFGMVCAIIIAILLLTTTLFLIFACRQSKHFRVFEQQSVHSSCKA